MSQTQIQTRHLPRRPGLFNRITQFLLQSSARRRDRRKLGHLDQRLLRDIGLDAVAATEECTKPFWRT